MFRQIENQNEHLNDKITLIQNENKELKSRINYFNESRLAVQNEISAVKTENKELKEIADYFKESKNEVEMELSSLKKENLRLKKDYDRLKYNSNTIKTNNKKLEGEIKDFKIENSNFKIQSTQLRNINKKLFKDYLLFGKSDNLLKSSQDALNIYVNSRIKCKQRNNELFTLWINENNRLPELQHLSIKSMLLTGHKVTLFTYEELENVPVGVEIADANDVLDKSEIFTYKEGFNKGSYSGFANIFRYVCLQETHKSWFDCDILAVKNINDTIPDGPVISSQYGIDGSIRPNNAFLRLSKDDQLLKSIRNTLKTIDLGNVKHGETGPALLKSVMDAHHGEYYMYLTDPNFVSPINFFKYTEYLNPSERVVPKLNLDEIWGFHIWNAMFRSDGNIHETVENGFYYDLKGIISSSNDEKQYLNKIRDLFKVGT